jgi:hypothetical protein
MLVGRSIALKADLLISVHHDSVRDEFLKPWTRARTHEQSGRKQRGAFEFVFYCNMLCNSMASDRIPRNGGISGFPMIRFQRGALTFRSLRETRRAQGLRNEPSAKSSASYSCAMFRQPLPLPMVDDAGPPCVQQFMQSGVWLRMQHLGMQALTELWADTAPR